MAKKMNDILRRGLAGILVLGMLTPQMPTHAATKWNVKISGTQIRVGAQKKIKSNKTQVKFRSQNPRIAAVSEEGIVTGKKPGRAVIVVKSPGGAVKKVTVQIKKRKGKPNLPVALSEVTQTEQTMEQNADGSYTYCAKIKNHASVGKIKKIEYVYEIQYAKSQSIASGAAESGVVSGAAVTAQPLSAETVSKTVTLTAKNISAGKTSEVLRCDGDVSGNVDAMQLKTIRLYAGKALYVYHVETKKGVLKWGVPDTKAPVISGRVKHNSVCNGEPYWICYSDRKSTYHFKKYVKAKDERDRSVKLHVDTSAIRWDKSGVYRVKYTARDKAGNVAKSWAKVQVIVPGTPESIADSVLRSITSSSWSDERKARAIYSYVRQRCDYVHNGPHSDWRNTAVSGIRYRTGDCYTFYSISKLLLTRAGIPNLTITRYPARVGAHHWWNLVYVHGGWYHFDTTPRAAGGVFCLTTDSQMSSYSNNDYTFQFIKSKYPARAVKIISATPHKG